MRLALVHASLALIVAFGSSACSGGNGSDMHDMSFGGGGGGGGGGSGNDDLGFDDMSMPTTAIPNFPPRDLLHDAPYLDVNANYRFKIAAAGTGWGSIGLEVPSAVANARIDLWTEKGVYLGGTSGGWTCNSGGTNPTSSPSRTLFLAFNSAKRGAQNYYAVVDAGGMQYSVEWYEATTKIPFSSTANCQAVNEDCTTLPAGHVAHAVDLDLVPGNNYNLKHDENCSCSNSTAQTFQFVVDSGGLRGDVGSSEKYEYVAAQCGKCGSDQAGIGADPGSDALHGVVLIDTSGPSRNPVNVCYQAQALTCGTGQQMCGVACYDPQTTTKACGASCTDCTTTEQHATGASCASAKCDYGACVAPNLDCDGDRTNGCETTCASLQHVTTFNCACDYIACAAGWTDCDGTRANGCEHEGDGCPVQLATGASANTIAVDATYVYFATSTSIKRAPIATQGLTQTLISGLSNVYRIAIDATHVYFTTGTEVDSIPLAGAASATALQTSQAGAYGLFVDANNYVWTNPTGHTVMVQAFSGGSPVIVATMNAGQTGQYPQNVIADATNAYWKSSDGSVWQAPLSGAGPVIRLDQPATNGGGDEQIAVDGTNVYWTGLSNGVYKNLIGAGNELSVAGFLYADYGLALDSTRIYYANYSSTGVFSILKDGTGVKTVTRTSRAIAITVDASYVYWYDGSSIYKSLK
jgi:hypothetical protein